MLKGKHKAAHLILNWAKGINDKFRVHNLVREPTLLVCPRVVRWSLLRQGIYKVNVDAALDRDGGRVGLGIVGRDADRFIHRGQF